MKNFYFLLFFTVFTFAQENEQPKLPQVFPVSPEAASLGKYGELPVNLATGKINYSVPLYTIKVKDFEWPISLSYNYSGLLVEEDPGVIGLGWDMIASGRITREIRGIPDELDVSQFKKTTIVPFLKGDFDNLSTVQYNAKKFQIYNSVAELNYDGMFDKYVVNAGEVNGSFVFNENDETIFLNNRNYKAWKNKIIDDKGVTYYFNEIEKGYYKIPTSGDDVDAEVPASYLLTKIQLPNNGGEINFEYEPASPQNRYYKTVWSDSEITGLENKIVHQSNDVMVEYRPLKKITFPTGEINFSVTRHSYSYTNQHGNIPQTSFALNELTVSNSNNDEILKYEFIYNNNSKSKKLLNEIIKSSNGSTIPFFKFEYDHQFELGSLDFDYTSQDLWGYYNALSSPNLITATREIVPIKTKYGALDKIVYPTGGYSEIEYEQNTISIEESGTATICSYSHNQSITEVIVPDAPYQQKIIDKIIDVGHSQIVKVKIRAAVKKGSSTNALGNWANISVTANNASNLCGQSIISNFQLNADADNCASYPNPNDCPGDLILYKEIIGYAEDGKLHITGDVSVQPNKEAFIEYTIEYEATTGPTVNNKNLGGIRVAKTVDCNNPNDCYETNYKYILEDGITSSGLTLGGGVIFDYTTNHISTSGGSQTGSKHYRSAKSKASFTSYQGAPVLYERVEIIKNNGENGKTINYYSKATNTNPAFPFHPPTNNDWEKGKLLISEQKKFNNAYFDLISKEQNSYQIFYPFGFGASLTKKVYGLSVSRQTYSNNADPDHYAADWNYEYSKEYLISSSVKTNYLDGQTTTTQKTFSYDSPYGQIIEIESINSVQDALIQKIYYPYNFTGPNNLSLVDQNRITIPIKKENYKITSNNPEELIFTQHTYFKNWGNNIILPEYVKTAKGNGPLEERIIYTGYDLNGNVTEVKLSDGPVNAYVWGYNKSFPVAKVEGATYTDVVNTGVNLSVLDNLLSSSASKNTELEIIRNGLLKAMVTTYVYDPLVGVTSITDPRGYSSNYVYDDFQRLSYIEDDDEKVIKKFNYNYDGTKQEGYASLNLNINTPSAVVNNSNATISSVVTGGSGNFLYQWHIDGQPISAATSSIQYSFYGLGNISVSLTLIDTVTGLSKTATGSVTVYQPLSTPVLSSSTLQTVINSAVSLTSSGISGGSGTKSYEWYIDNVLQSATGTNFSPSFTAAGAHVVKFRVVDGSISGHFSEISTTLNAYNPLIEPSLTSNLTYVINGEQISFSAGNISGGSGDRSYEWFLNNVKQTNTSANFVYTPASAGTYTVRFRVNDDTITGHYQESSKVVYSYNILSTPGVAPNQTYVLNGTNIIFNTSNIGGGSGNRGYEWYVNDVLQSGSASNFVLTPSSTGNYVVRFRVKDLNIINHFKEGVTTVYSYSSMSTPTISSNKTYVVNGSVINFTTGNINFGSGYRNYEWFVNNVKQSGTSTSFNYTPSNSGTYSIKFRVNDDRILGHYKEVSTTVYSYVSLSTPNLYANKSYITEGNSISFTTSGIGGGSGNISYQWYLNNVIQSANGTSYSPTFNADGNYTMKFRVVDNNTGQYTEKSVAFEVYNPLVTGAILVPSNVTVNTSTNFNINPTGGSGLFTYNWSITTPWTSYSSTSKSFSLNMNYDYYGSRTATCIVTDTRTGEIITVNGGFNVNGAPTLGGKLLKSTITSNTYFADYLITANPLSGSGYYSYQWYLDGSSSISGSSNTYEINLSCSNLTDSVRCVITDSRTGQTKTVLASYSFTGSCGGGGGGGAKRPPVQQ